MDEEKPTTSKQSHLFLIHTACILFILIPLWWCDFPSGIDLPQHANLFRTLASKVFEETDTSFLYEVNFFTPYLTTYILGATLAAAFNAVVACKLILSLTVILTGVALHYWLKSCKLELRLALFGYPLAFDYHYHWGILSFGLSVPLVLFILGIIVADEKGVTVKQGLIVSILLLILAATHVSSFLLTISCTAVISLFSLRRITYLFSLLPSIALFLCWELSVSRPSTEANLDQDIDLTYRLLLLIGGYFSALPSTKSIIAGFVCAGFIAVLLKPKLKWSVGAGVPFIASLFLFLGPPETLGGTSLVMTRYLVFVHLFVLGLIAPSTRPSILSRIAVCVVGLILLFDIRLIGFNTELRGLKQLAMLVPLNSSLAGENLLTKPHSTWMGYGQLKHVDTWVTSIRGGVYSNDFAHYFQLPIQRRSGLPWVRSTSAYLSWDGPEPTPLRWSRPIGPVDQTTIASNFRLVLLKKLFYSDGLEITRWGQDWGELVINKSVEHRPITIAGKNYTTGLGSHVNGWVQLKAPERDCTVRIGCGIDDNSGGLSHAQCSIEDEKGGVLWSSRKQSSKSPPQFEILKIRAGQSIFLIGRTVVGHGTPYGHLDWIISPCNEST